VANSPLQSALNASLEEARRLGVQRDITAYRLVGAVTVAIQRAEAEDWKEVLRILRSARDAYDKADKELQDYYKRQHPEVSRG
jgi:hypothetical protein